MALDALIKNFSVDFSAGRTKREIKDKMVSKEIHLKQRNLQSGWTDVNAIGSVNRLLKSKRKEPHGKGGIKEVMERLWLRGRTV